MVARSNIQVFLQAIGHPQVIAAMTSVANASSRLQARLQRSGINLNSVMGAVTNASGRMIRNMGGLVPAFNLAGSAAKGMLTSLKLAGGLVAGMAAAAVLLARTVDETDDSYQRMAGTVQGLRALNNEINSANGRPTFAANKNGPGLVDTNGGNARQTAQDLDFLSRTADRTGNAVLDLAKDYLQLKASAQGTGAQMGDLQRTFAGFASAGVVLGLTTDQIHNANVALGQMASKGKVSAEELKGQMAEAIPGVIGVAARAYGVSVGKLLEMVQAGELEFADFNKRLGAQLQSEYGSAAGALVNTTRIAKQRLKNELTDAKVLIGSGGLDEAFGKLMNSIGRIIKTLKANGAFDRFGATVGASLDRVTDALDKAQASGFDFEVFLRSAAKGFDLYVRTVTATATALGKFLAALEYAKLIFRAGNVYSDNPFANFLASIAHLAEAAGTALSAFFGANVRADAEDVGKGFNGAAYWVNQFAYAIDFLSTKKVGPGMTNDGAAIAKSLQKARDVAYTMLQVGIKIAVVMAAMIEFVAANSDTFIAFFQGAADALNGMSDAAGLLGDILKSVGIDTTVGYLIGFLLVLGKILPLLQVMGGLLLGMSGTAALIAAAIGLAAVEFYIVVNNWDEIKARLGALLDEMSAGFANIFADILDWIPGLGRAAEAMRDQADIFLGRAEKAGADFRDQQTARESAEARAKQGESGGLEALLASVKANQANSPLAADLDTMIARQTAAIEKSVKLDPLAAGQAAVTAQGGQVQGNQFGKPVQIYLTDGTALELRGKAADAVRFEELAAKTAANRPGQSPAWAG